MNKQNLVNSNARIWWSTALFLAAFVCVIWAVPPGGGGTGGLNNTYSGCWADLGSCNNKCTRQFRYPGSNALARNQCYLDCDDAYYACTRHAVPDSGHAGAPGQTSPPNATLPPGPSATPNPTAPPNATVPPKPTPTPNPLKHKPTPWPPHKGSSPTPTPSHPILLSKPKPTPSPRPTPRSSISHSSEHHHH